MALLVYIKSYASSGHYQGLSAHHTSYRLAKARSLAASPDWENTVRQGAVGGTSERAVLVVIAMAATATRPRVNRRLASEYKTWRDINTYRQSC